MKWIRVEDALPEPLKNVIVCHKCGDGTQKVEEGYLFYSGEWLFKELSGQVTHWMPMPEPPQCGDRYAGGEEDRQYG